MKGCEALFSTKEGETVGFKFNLSLHAVDSGKF
jgi:hypothetical protein